MPEPTYRVQKPKKRKGQRGRVHQQLAIQALMPKMVHDALIEIATAAQRGEVHVYGLWVRGPNSIPTRSDIIRAALGIGLRELTNLDQRLAEVPTVAEALACWDLTPEQWAALP